MDVDTLLTRQMELHTTTRRPPKNSEQLIQLRDTLIEYKHFFQKLQSLTIELDSDRGTVFQCLMHISVGGAVKFDSQAQNAGMPMHQAKVLARWSAIELEPLVRERVHPAELMVYVGLSRDLRSTLRVKVEDENDLNTVQKTVEDSVEYLDFIYTHSHGDPKKMFDFYMIEDGPSLLKMLHDSDPAAASQSSFLSFSGSQQVPSSMLVQQWNPKAPFPPLENLLEEMESQITHATASKVHASERVVAAQNVLDWLAELSDAHFKELFVGILRLVVDPLAALCNDKRSTLCRVSCEIIVLLSERATSLDCVSVLSGNTEVYAATLGKWTSSLLKGIYVTISAISVSTDSTVRKLILLNHGNIAMVQSILMAVESGKQTELRRKCLGYLALCVAAAEARVIGGGNAYTSLLIPIAENFVEVGDSPSRKMARALCAVLRGITLCQVNITNPKINQLVEKEMEQLKPHFASTRILESKLFETADFVSSIGSNADVIPEPIFSLNAVDTPNRMRRRNSMSSLAEKGAERLRSSNSNINLGHTPRRHSKIVNPENFRELKQDDSGTAQDSVGRVPPTLSTPHRRLHIQGMHKSPGLKAAQQDVNDEEHPVVERLSRHIPRKFSVTSNKGSVPWSFLPVDDVIPSTDDLKESVNTEPPKESIQKI